MQDSIENIIKRFQEHFPFDHNKENSQRQPCHFHGYRPPIQLLTPNWLLPTFRRRSMIWWLTLIGSSDTFNTLLVTSLSTTSNSKTNYLPLSLKKNRKVLISKYLKPYQGTIGPPQLSPRYANCRNPPEGKRLQLIMGQILGRDGKSPWTEVRRSVMFEIDPRQGNWGKQKPPGQNRPVAAGASRSKRVDGR